MQKVVPKSFEFVPEHSYAALILRSKTEPCRIVSSLREQKLFRTVYRRASLLLFHEEIPAFSSAMFNTELDSSIEQTEIRATPAIYCPYANIYKRPKRRIASPLCSRFYDSELRFL